MKQEKLGVYEHYKGEQYEVVGFAKHSETLEDLVVYRALYNSPEFGPNSLWVRPRQMFFEQININGKEAPRFRYLHE